jgi:hypothetical protein
MSEGDHDVYFNKSQMAERLDMEIFAITKALFLFACSMLLNIHLVSSLRRNNYGRLHGRTSVGLMPSVLLHWPSFLVTRVSFGAITSFRISFPCADAGPSNNAIELCDSTGGRSGLSSVLVEGIWRCDCL